MATPARSNSWRNSRNSKLEQDVTKAPAGLDPVVWAAYVPEDNKMTPERVELGRKLYFDTRLSQRQLGFLRHLP